MSLDMKEQLQALKEKLNSEITQNNGVKHIDGGVEHRENNNVHSNGLNLAINKTNYAKDSNERINNGQQMEYKRGDIFWVNFGETGVGSEQMGMRPVINIQNQLGSKHSPTLIVAVITSSLTKAKLPIHVEIKAPNFGLSKDSVVLLEQIKTIDKKRVVSYIGHVDEETMKLIDNAKDISMSELKPKSLLERLPEMMRTFIITTLKQIKKYEITVETMKNEGMTNDDVQFIVNKKLSVLNKFIKYCKEHQIDYTAFYKLNEGVVNKEIVL